MMKTIACKAGKEKTLKQFISFTAFSFFVFVSYMNFEPVVVGAASVTDDITVTQHVTGDISISHPADVNMAGTIYGMTGGTGSGSATWTVVTSNVAGFNMSLKADAANCLRLNGTDHFDDYSRTNPLAYNWSAPAISGFGFTVEPETPGDTVQVFRDNAGACNAAGGGNTADTCWSGFNGTTDIPVIMRSSATDGGGESEVVKFKAQLAAGQFLPEGDYIATITATATAN